MCAKLDKNIWYYLNSVTTWRENGPYHVVNRATSNGYLAYIKANDKVIYVRGFPDFGGAGPSEAEKNICAVNND